MQTQATTLTPRQRQLILAVVGLALMMVMSAVSGLNVALPDLARDIGATQNQLLWIVDAYTVVFAGLLLSAGALGDRFGRKWLLLFGLITFGIAAAAAMMVNDPTQLIALRAVMGLGAAAVMPATLSIITASFPEEEKGKAIGFWVGVAGGGAIVGLLGSGLLLEYFSWNSFFALNVGLAIVAAIGTLIIIPNSVDEHPPAFDIPGSVLSLATVSSLVFGIVEGPERGWNDPVTLAALAIGALSLLGFVWWELRLENPMLDPRLFLLRGFGTGSLSLMVQFLVAFGFFFVALQYLQFIVGFSPLEAAVRLMPMPLVMIPLARRAPALADRFGINKVGSSGLLLIGIGLAIISFVGVDFQLWKFTIGLVLFAAGMALAGTPATAAIVSSLPSSKQGVASAVNDLSREFGSALGIALLGSILNSRYRDNMEPAVTNLPPEMAERAKASIAFVQSSAIGDLGPAGEQLVNTAKQAFLDGVSASLLTAVGITVVTAAYVALRAPASTTSNQGASHVSNLESAKSEHP